MEDHTQQEQVSLEVHKRIQDSFDRQGLMSHLGSFVWISRSLVRVCR